MSVLTRSALSSSFNSNLPDNTSGLITPAVLRTELVNIVDSAILPEDSASIVAEWDGTRNGDGEITGSLIVTATGSFGILNYAATTVTGSTIIQTFEVSSSQTVSVNHNLNFDFPFVQIYGPDRVNILADISSSNANTTIVGPFDAETSGSIIISKMI